MFTSISAELSQLAGLPLRLGASFRATGSSTRVGPGTCAAVPSWVFAAGSVSGGPSGDPAIRLAELISNPSSIARLAAALSSISERGRRRVSLAGLLGVLLMIKRPLGEFSQHPAPQLPDFLRGSSR